ncbi:aldo/keto reductase [Streptomyces sp. NPDC015350]|uniref:aldo/keto reductase n=1 Tax=Streptomyces sp. NPDC015350 TaxID=3364955 RepID=UPI0036FC510A
MEFRRLGRGGLTISGIAHGNWLTHGSQVEEDTAAACIRAALDAGITTFDTADVHAGTRAEAVLGRAPEGEPREGIEVFTEVRFPTGPGHNDRGLGRKHIMESIDNSPRRLRTDHVDLYQAHRHDHSTPLEETMEAFADVVRSGKALHIGVSERTPSGADVVADWLRDEVLERVQRLRPLADGAGLGLARLAVAWVPQNPNVSAAIIGASRPEQVTENVGAAGVALDAELLKGIDDILDPVVERNPALTAGHAGDS